MRNVSLKSVVVGLCLGVGLTACAANLFAQPGTAQPVKSETQYFVTGEGDDAHLWVREGTKLRCVGHGECKTHGDHKGHDDDHDGHDHDKEKAKP